MTTASSSARDAPAGAPPARSRRRLPLGGWGLLPLAGAIILIAFPFASDDLFWQNMIILSMLFAIGAVGLNIISGWGGYISLGQSAFVGVGAYTVGLGALLLGVGETMTTTYVGPEWATAVPFVVIFVVLLLRPQGLLGARLREDVAL